MTVDIAIWSTLIFIAIITIMIVAIKKAIKVIKSKT